MIILLSIYSLKYTSTCGDYIVSRLADCTLTVVCGDLNMHAYIHQCMLRAFTSTSSKAYLDSCTATLTVVMYIFSTLTYIPE